VALLHGLAPAIRAVAAAAWWRAWPDRTEPPPDSPVAVRYLEPGPVLSERASREVLAAYAVPLVASAAARDADTAAVAAERIGFPVVVKADAAVAHKAAAGLVRVGLGTAAQVREAFAQVMASAGADTRGVLVQAVAAGVEVICGMRRDPLFGPVVLAGVGGTLTEVLHDVAVRACPVSAEDPAEMLAECAVGRLLAATGAEPAPVLETIAALSRLATEHPEIAEVDVNPLFVGPHGAWAADALVVLDGSGATAT
jgi:acyl-CoA synthetase (NDP forming)